MENMNGLYRFPSQNFFMKASEIRKFLILNEKKARYMYLNDYSMILRKEDELLVYSFSNEDKGNYESLL